MRDSFLAPAASLSRIPHVFHVLMLRTPPHAKIRVFVLQGSPWPFSNVRTLV